MRAATRQRLRHFNVDEDFLPEANEICTDWEMGKDGKSWFDAKDFPKLMRK